MIIDILVRSSGEMSVGRFVDTHQMWQRGWVRVREAVIVEAVRTPVGKGRAGGALHEWHPVDLFAEVLRDVVERSGIDPGRIDDVIGGIVTPIGEQGGNLTRQSVLSAGYPEHVPATTIDRKCGSSQQAVHFAAQGIMAGAYDVVVAGGVEMLSRVTMQSNTAGADHLGPGIRRRYPQGVVSQGIAAELVAKKWNLSREELDELSAESHRRAAHATDTGAFAREITPLVTSEGVHITSDEGIRADSTAQRLAGLKPAFRTDDTEAAFPDLDWVVTAGNSSQISDAASAVLVMDRELAEQLGHRPRARFISFAVVGDDPFMMLTGVMPATRKALDRAGLTLEDVDLFEVNEAFASIALAWQREFDVDASRVNVRGSGISLGHPLGASGTRIMTTLLHALEDTGGRIGLQVMCEAGGQANATIIERLD